MSKILIIEDEPDIVMIIRERLRREEYEVITASDGYQGVEYAHSNKPDLIILDLMIPAGDGLWVLKTLQMSAETKYIPVIVVTGMADEKYKQKVMKEGVAKYMEKPFDMYELIGAVKELLGKDTEPIGDIF